MPRTYLVILGDRDAIEWVLREQRMAFPSTPRAELAKLAVDDQLLLYATRGAWGNPRRDRGRMIGNATVCSAIRALDEPLEIAGRRFHSECNLAIDGLVPYPGGVELQPLVGDLAAFPKPEAWSAYMRRALLELPQADAHLLRGQLAPLVRPRRDVLATYTRTAAARG